MLKLKFLPTLEICRGVGEFIEKEKREKDFVCSQFDVTIKYTIATTPMVSMVSMISY